MSDEDRPMRVGGAASGGGGPAHGTMLPVSPRQIALLEELLLELRAIRALLAERHDWL